MRILNARSKMIKTLQFPRKYSTISCEPVACSSWSCAWRHGRRQGGPCSRRPGSPASCHEHTHQSSWEQYLLSTYEARDVILHGILVRPVFCLLHVEHGQAVGVDAVVTSKQLITFCQKSTKIKKKWKWAHKKLQNQSRSDPIILRHSLSQFDAILALFQSKTIQPQFVLYESHISDCNRVW